MKMTCKRPYLGRPGEPVTLYGYSGVFGEDGAAVLDVPESFVEGEIVSGRLLAPAKDSDKATRAQDRPKDPAPAKDADKA